MVDELAKRFRWYTQGLLAEHQPDLQLNNLTITTGSSNELCKTLFGEITRQRDGDHKTTLEQRK
jgi:hypothetical protein